MATFTPKESEEFAGWFEIPGYSNYLANKEGEIMNKKFTNPTKGGNAGRYLKTKVYADGNDEPEMVYVHTLICLAFHGKPKNGQVVLHKDDNRENNTHDNLSWGEQVDNVKDYYSKNSNESIELPSLKW